MNYCDSVPIVSIYCSENPYGYRYNINHPKINELYKRYTKWKGLIGRPLTDAERYEFERYLDTVFVKERKIV